MKVHVEETRSELGKAAARDISIALKARLREQNHVRMILAAAPSQGEMLAALRHAPDIDWARVSAFHMDEYIGLPADASQRFSNWLRREFVDHVPLARFEAIDPEPNPETTCRRYSEMLAEDPVDLVLLGIGTNGHLAFNDPPANLSDPESVKVVTLDRMCREQQVLDGCFRRIEDVPRQAITLTIPRLLAGRELFCCVPGKHKSAAVRSTLESAISGDCPATTLRTHPQCNLYLDRDSYSASESSEHA